MEIPAGYFSEGPVGGEKDGGIPFAIFPPKPGWRIDRIDIVAYWAIEDIFVHYESPDGVRQIVNKFGNTDESGGPYGKSETWDLGPAHFLKELKGRHGQQSTSYRCEQAKDGIITLQFFGYTQGNSEPTGQKSDLKQQGTAGGGSGGFSSVTKSFQFQAPTGQEIVGFTGKYGSGDDKQKTINSLGVLFGPMHNVPFAEAKEDAEIAT
ncbi:MAG: hypothetical protein HRU33_15825 [Rhodobacteraceae bacterium]|nr:hypothetical protein [Paracoccaceae bacterium]